jgi:hypothetical protein
MNAPEAPSSVSDFSRYRMACAAAAADPGLLRSFRCNPEISGIIEPYIPPESADKRLVPSAEELIERLKDEPDFADLYPIFRRNDEIGDPPLTEVNGLGAVSVYTLRYIKIAYDLRRLFGSLDGLHIIEIGGGYGGQCAILSRLFGWASYTIVDLPEVLSLQQAYLKALGVENVVFQTKDQIASDQSWDITVSNYAYSELSEDLRAFYLDRVLAKSRRGYMLWNYLVLAFQRSGQDFIAALKEELEVFAKILERIPNLRFVDELRLSNDVEYRNHVAVWGHADPS